MCGGIGSRFWPASRQNKPKQFLDFMGTGRTLLQMTCDRISSLIPPERVIIVTNADYKELVLQQLPDINPDNILLEPARRNTAPCIAWAAKHVRALDPEASMVVMPSDHLIMRERVFLDALERAFEFVESNNALVTLGIKPSRPETGYGYIQTGEKAADGINRVKTFTEKPNEEMAKLFLSTGEFLWNAGVFIWTARNVLAGLAQYAPEIYARFSAPDETFANHSAETELIAREFPACPSISIDYALMEKADNVYVEEVDPGWSDVGTWGALHEVSPKDRNANVLHGCSVKAYETSGTIFSETNPRKLIVVDGLKDYIIADTDDVLLICPIGKEQQIKQYVNDIANTLGEKYL